MSPKKMIPLYLRLRAQTLRGLARLRLGANIAEGTARLRLGANIAGGEARSRLGREHRMGTSQFP